MHVQALILTAKEVPLVTGPARPGHLDVREKQALGRTKEKQDHDGAGEEQTE